MDWRWIPEIKSLIVHLHIDTRDAMGANIVNTMCEKLAPILANLLCCETGLRILTNLTENRLAKAVCKVPASAFNSRDYIGEDVVDRIVKAWEFAWHDVYRATTNNKGIMNGIDPVLIATGNDWRAIEAGAHAWTARSGSYKPMARWSRDDLGNLCGELELPMAVGTVGGVTKLHPTARAALQLMGSPNARELAGICCAVGLAQNLSALRALASEGIQRGHMGLHQKNLNLAADGKRSGACAAGETLRTTSGKIKGATKS
jgi:hydroxymethylglutaryl-CoA reductase